MSNNADALVETIAAPASAGAAPASGGPLRALVSVRWGDYLGVAPFLIFAVLFLIVPTLFLVIGAFQAPDGSFTLQNIIDLGTPQILKAPTAAGDGEGFLIVDDLVDTGVTAKLVRTLLPRAHFSCVYAKPAGQPATDTFVAGCQRPSARRC